MIFFYFPLSERCGKLKYLYFGGSISAFPAIETINPDITEYIATNVISITDGQFYMNKRLFLDSCRPANRIVSIDVIKCFLKLFISEC